MLKNYTICIIFQLALFMPSLVVAQNEKFLEEYLANANQSYEIENYSEAIEYYMMALRLSDSRIQRNDLTVKIAECYRLDENYSKAEGWYYDAINLNDDIELCYWYAQILRINGKEALYLKMMEKYAESGGQVQDEYYASRNMTSSSNEVNISTKKTPTNDSLYYALIIGNNNYQDSELITLDQPIQDALSLYNVLISKYTFEKQNVILLKDATREDIIRALDGLSNELTFNDNLLIFYAGHGHWNEQKNIGYWLPVDAQKDITTDWLRNSTIQSYIEIIDTKHTLLIADACFGGGIFKTRAAFDNAERSIRNLYKYESRKAMTSGMLNEVPDKSVFMENLLERLQDNEENYISSSDLFMQFRNNVMNNSNNTPQFGTIHNTGDKGGDFIFILK